MLVYQGPSGIEKKSQNDDSYVTESLMHAVMTLNNKIANTDNTKIDTSVHNMLLSVTMMIAM